MQKIKKNLKIIGYVLAQYYILWIFLGVMTFIGITMWCAIYATTAAAIILSIIFAICIMILIQLIISLAVIAWEALQLLVEWFVDGLKENIEYAKNRVEEESND